MLLEMCLVNKSFTLPKVEIIKIYIGLSEFYLNFIIDTDTCMRMCCGPQRGFVINILDNANQVNIYTHNNDYIRFGLTI